MFSPSKHVGVSNTAAYGTPSPVRSPGSFVDSARPVGVVSFDYVIAGGGTAGCALASRLSEDPGVTVLLIEAGDADTKQLMSRVPAGWGNLFKSPAEWGFETTPQAELNSRELYCPRGKMVGGTSAINAQILQHCSPEDYQQWEANGATGWGWKDLKPYFKKSECHTESTVPPTSRGIKGPFKTSLAPTNEITTAYVETGPQVGIPRVADFDVETPSGGIGIARFFTASFKGVRTTASTAYLPPSIHQTRKNLTVLTLTTVTRLLLSSSGTCMGVEVGQTREGQRWDIYADREVIVSMGTYGSPQLLLASGIGRKTELKKVGVLCAKELDGVGQGLQDHLLVTINWEAKRNTSLQFLTNPVSTLPHLVRWLYNGTGPLGTNLAEAAAFVRSDNIPGRSSSVPKGASNASGPTSPDIEIINAPLYYSHHGIEKAPKPNADYFTLAPIILKPKSEGTVSLRSSDMFDAPAIDPKFLTNELDRRVLLEGMKVARDFSRAEPLKNYLLEAVSPMNFDTADDEALLAHARASCEHIYHPTSTCRIGKESEGGVVDNNLRVHGIKGLRVCDASVFPSICSGHPVGAILAVAERAADLIKQSGTGL